MSGPTFDWFEEVTSGFEACVCAMVAFGWEAHGGTVGAACASGFVVAVRILAAMFICNWPYKTHVPLQCHANLTSTGP